MAREENHFAFINALRGCAALLVFYFHLHLHVFAGYPERQVSEGSFTYWVVYGFFDLGKFGVALFFIVSGFLIPATLERPGAVVRTFASQRAFRIYPAYWTALALVAIFTFATPNFSWRQWAVNLTLLQGFVGVGDVLGVTWTLQIELVYYVICAGLFASGRFAGRGRWLWIALAGALGCAAARHLSGRKLPVALFLGLTLMFWGDAVRGSLRTGSTRRVLWLAAAILAVLGPTAVLGYGTEARRYVVSYAAAVGVFLIAFRYRRWFAECRLRGALAWLANGSYSVYLLHAPLGLTAAAALRAAGWHSSAIAVVVIPLTLGAAQLVYHVVEAPAVRLGKRLTRPDVIPPIPVRKAA
jgi:peptidoglycan/LPS O-acetylase OafA/YrhL